MAVRVEAEFRSRWWPCTVATVDGTAVVVCAAGDVAAAVPVRVRWERCRGPCVAPLAEKVEAESEAVRLGKRYTVVTVRESRRRRKSGRARR